MKFKVNDVFYTKNNDKFQLIEINKFPGGEYYKLEELLHWQWNFDLANKWYFDRANIAYLKEPANFCCAYKDLFKFESVLRKPGECTEQELILFNREFLIEKDYLFRHNKLFYIGVQFPLYKGSQKVILPYNLPED